jgi:hypothetical protein
MYLEIDGVRPSGIYYSATLIYDNYHEIHQFFSRHVYDNINEFTVHRDMMASLTMPRELTKAAFDRNE